MKSRIFGVSFLILAGLITLLLLILDITESLSISGNQICLLFTNVEGDFGIDTETHLFYTPLTTFLLALLILNLIISA